MLAELLARRGPLTATLAVDIAIRVAYTLAAANRTSAQGMLTTDTIQLTPDGRVIVHPMTAADDAAEARTPYTPPEMIRGDAPSAASDVFALGAVLVEMLTGRTRPTKATVSGLPADLQAILECALARDPGDRYADSRSFARTLDAWRRNQFDVETARAYPIEAPSPVAAPRQRAPQADLVRPPPSADTLSTEARGGISQPGGTWSRTIVDPSERYPVTPDERPDPAPGRGRRRSRRRSIVDPSERYPVVADTAPDPDRASVPRRDRRTRSAMLALVAIAAAAILLTILVFVVFPDVAATAPPGSAATPTLRSRSMRDNRP